MEYKKLYKGLTNLPQTKSSLKKCHSTVLSEYTVWCIVVKIHTQKYARLYISISQIRNTCNYLQWQM